MFKFVYKRFQTATFFEKMLLVVGIAIGITGFWFINRVYYNQPGLSWQFLMSIFLWLILIFLVILTDSNESIKEELSIIMKENIEEIKLLKEETKLIREEITMLNKNLTKKSKK